MALKIIISLLFLLSSGVEHVVGLYIEDLRFSLGGTVYFNNSVIPITDIGVGVSSTPLECITDLRPCCRQEPSPQMLMGQWRYPNGSMLPGQGGSNDFFRTRGENDGTVNLFRRNSGVVSPFGSYCCEIPDTTGDNRRLCANLAPSGFSFVINDGGVVPTTGQSYSLTCSVSGGSVGSYKWWKDGVVLQGQTTEMLSFSPLGLSDAGRYTCQVTVTASSQTFTAYQNHSVIIQTPDPTVTVTSNPGTHFPNVSVTCTVEMAQGLVDSDLSLLIVDAQLSRDGTPLTLTGPTVTGTTFTYTIQLDSFGRNDSGNYTCSATVRPRKILTYLIGSGFQVHSINITVPNSVSVTSDQPNPIRPIGSTVTLTCTVVLAEYVEGLTVNTVWTGPNGFSENGTAQRMGSTTNYTSTAMVRSFGRDQSGDYTCTATVISDSESSLSMVNITMSSSTRVIVGVYLSLKGVVYPNNSVILITEIGQTNTTSNNGLQCITDRRPCCSSENRQGEWFYPSNGGVFPQSGDDNRFYRNRGDDGTVNLNRVNNDVMMPTGRFCCVVPDANGVSQWACAVILPSKPIVSLTSNLSNPILSGSAVTLTCTVELSPEVDVPVTVNAMLTGPSITSISATLDLPRVPDSLTLYRSSRILESVESSHYGQYECTAKFGIEVSASINIEIVDGIFQLRLKGVDICTRWYITRSSKEAIKYVHYIDMALVEAVERRSKCHFPVTNLLEGSFSCEESPDLMTYRSAVVGTHNFNGSRIIGFIQDWVSSGPRIKIDRSHVRVDSSCPVALTSLDEPECVTKAKP